MATTRQSTLILLPSPHFITPTQQHHVYRSAPFSRRCCDCDEAGLRVDWQVRLGQRVRQSGGGGGEASGDEKFRML